MKKTLIFIFIISFTICSKAQQIELFSSFTNTDSEYYNSYGGGLGIYHKLNDNLHLSIRYLHEVNSSNYIHQELPQIIIPSLELEDQINFSIEHSAIKNHSIGFSLLYSIITHDFAHFTIGPDLSYNYFIGTDSYYKDEFTRNKIGLGAQIRMDIKELFSPQLGLYMSILPNYSIGLESKVFDYGLEEPYVNNLGFIDFQLGFSYKFKKQE